MLTEAGRVVDNIRCIVLDATNIASVDWRCVLRLLVSVIIHSKASEGYVRTGTLSRSASPRKVADHLKPWSTLGNGIQE